ncbi:MAG: energy transducer TonB [Myxococcota bacterium]
MILRLGSCVFPSLLVHGALFAALTTTPDSVEPRSLAEVVEFIAITDEGGGREGEDRQIGDTAEPQAVPEKKFRQVKPKATRPRPTPEIVAIPTPSQALDSRGDENVAVTDQSAAGASTSGQVAGSAGSNPNATRAGSGTGEEGVDRRSALRAWLREIQHEVNKIATRNYPSSAVRMKLEGKLRVGITIGADGRILGVRVLSSSGHSVLDESATESVMTLHIPPPPKALGWREREISLPIRYALE